MYVYDHGPFTSSDSPRTSLSSIQGHLFRRIPFGIPRPMRPSSPTNGEGI